WVQHRKQYPQLSKMALDLLACPAMSSNCERTFSTTGWAMGIRRSRLHGDTVESIECLRSWQKAGL
ncbi:uncharacterized protein K452DRAFT_216424, partial [Aplosporella prunicola CBS 121167]